MLYFERNVHNDYKNLELNIEIGINNGANHLPLLQSQNIIDKAIHFLIDEK